MHDVPAFFSDYVCPALIEQPLGSAVGFQDAVIFINNPDGRLHRVEGRIKFLFGI
jgi:hypothetical protein